MTYTGKQPDQIRSMMETYEGYSYPLVEQVSGWFNSNSDIRWYSNSIGDFEDENITQLYQTDQYSRDTRWEFWNKLLPVLKDNNIKTNLDIGCANNHFSFLCNKNGIFSVGIDPREDCVRTSDKIFKEQFGNTFGYVGTIKTFVDHFAQYNEQIFDCVTVLNFLHGGNPISESVDKYSVGNHVPEEIEKLFNILPRIANYAIVSEPNWDNLGLPVMTTEFKKLGSINNTACDHILYKL